MHKICLMASVARYNLVTSMIPEQDDDFLQILDEDTVLNGLRNETSPTKRISILESLRMSVRRNGGQLQIQERLALFNAIHDVLLDNDVNTRLACLNLLCEVIPDFGNGLDECIGLVLPQVIVFIGHNQVSLKKLAVQTLHVYMRHSEHLENVLNAIIKVGLESENEDTRMESLIALPILITPNFANEDLFPLTEALARRIAGSAVDSSLTSDTSSLALISLERIRKVVGKVNFERYVQQLQPRFQNVLNESMKSLAIALSKEKSRKSRSAGISLEDTSRVGKTNLDRGFTIANMNDEQTAKFDGSYLPSRISIRLTDSDWRAKEQGIDDLRSWLNDKHNIHCLLPHLEHFMCVLKELLNDSNFKVNLSCLQLFGVIIDELGVQIEGYLDLFVNVLASKLGDNKSIMKQTNMLVFKKLMQNISPNKVLFFLKDNIKHRNSRVREETLNVFIAALLTFPSNKFDLPQVTSYIAPALMDTKSRVRHAALEAFAVINQVLGPSNLQPLVSVVDKIELQVGGEGVMAAVQARFARRQLPKLNPDGLVAYAISLHSIGSAKVNANLSPRGADVEWILAAGLASDCPLSARSTPGVNDSAANNTRHHLSAGKNRLPWEINKLTLETREEHPRKIKPSWEDSHKQHRTIGEPSSYSVKYNNRKVSSKDSNSFGSSREYNLLGSFKDTNPFGPSNVMSTYSQLYKNKSEKRDVSRKSMKENNLRPIVNGTNGYSLIYKKGTHSENGTLRKSNQRSLERNNSIGAKSLSPFDSHLPKSLGTRRNTTNMIGVANNTNLSTSLPDWSELSDRQKKLLSPVSSGINREEELLSSSSERHECYNETPIQTKPTLVRSASKKDRLLKSIDVSDVTSPRLSKETSAISLSPVPPRKANTNAHQLRSVEKMASTMTSQTENNPELDSLRGCRTWSAGSRKNVGEDLPFETRPRIPRTPVRRKSSSDVIIGSPLDLTIGNTRATLCHSRDKSARDTHVDDIQSLTIDDNTNVKKKMEVIGHKLDTSENNGNQKMTSTLGSTSGVGSSLEESGELKNRFFDNEQNVEVENVEYESEYEEDTDSDVSLTTSNDSPMKDGELLKDYELHVHKLDHSGTSSDSIDEDESYRESLNDSEGYNESDEDFIRKLPSSEEENNHYRTERQSLSKSTRERMERKRIEEEQRIIRERHRIEELERQNQLKLESKEQSLQEKLAKEQQEIENLIKRKEKERKKERKIESKKCEETEHEHLLSSRNEIEELEHARKVFRQRERVDTLKRLQRKKEMDNVQVNSLAIQGYHAPSLDNVGKLEPVVGRPAVNEITALGSSTINQPHISPLPSRTVVSRPPANTRKSTNARVAARVTSCQDNGENIKQSQGFALSINSTIPIWEVTEQELKPFSSCDNALKSTLKLLADAEWESKCSGLLSVRRLIRHHSVNFCEQLHVFILAVVAEVKNLRSQVSRAAIFTLGDMFTCLEKHMDLDIDVTTSALLKKAGESSSFIRGDVDNALLAMIKSVSPGKALAALVTGGCGHRNVNVRKTCAQYIMNLSERLGAARCLNGSKELTERILVAAAEFVSDGGALTRYYGRRILYMLDGHNDFERMLNKYLPAKSLNPTMTIIENMRIKGLGDTPNDMSSARVRKDAVNSGVSSRSSRGSSVMSSDATSSVASNVVSPVTRENSRKRARRLSFETTSQQDQEIIANLIEQLSSKDWQQRIKAIDDMIEMIETRIVLFSANIVKIMDGFVPRLVDNNSKVNLHALQCLLRVVPTLRDVLSSCLSSLLPAVGKNLTSKNVNISSTAENVLDSFIKHLDNGRLLQPLCQFIGAVHNKTAIMKLLIIIKDVYTRKPTMVIKYSVPVLWKLLEPARSASFASSTIREAVHNFANYLYSLMGQSLFDLAQAKSNRVSQRLRELLE